MSNGLNIGGDSFAQPDNLSSVSLKACAAFDCGAFCRMSCLETKINNETCQMSKDIFSLCEPTCPKVAVAVRSSSIRVCVGRMKKQRL